jgi:hypothetical protein
MALDPDFQKLLKDSFWKEMNKLYTAMPCIVVNVHDDFKEQMVDVQPSINYVQKDDTSTPRSVILGVPVIQIGNETTALTMPVNKGDTVLCVFSMRAIEIWQESDGKPSNPNNRAKFHEKDAIAIPGLFPRRKAVNNPSNRSLPHSTKDTVLAANIGTANESEIRIKPSGMVQIVCKEALVKASTSITFDTPSASFTGDVQVANTLTAGTDVQAAGISLTGHPHDVPGVQSGSSTVTSLPPS